MYSYDEVYNSTLKYFNGDVLATNVFISKYALKDKNGNFLEKTPDDMHKRLAHEFARIESNYGGEKALSEEEIYNYFKNFTYICPQGSPMFGIGNNFVNVSLSNCTVIDQPKDNMSSIFDSAKDLANLFKRRAGCGIDISTLRPDGSKVNNAALTSSGAWSFSDLYSFISRMVGQNGRRAALLISMDVRHPDIEKFIVMKQDLTKVTGANISVKISDDFMNAVENDTEFTLRWPVDSETPKFTKVVKARDVWKVLINSATYFAEPGLLFWDTIKRNLPAECYDEFKTITTNPCLSGDTLVAVADGRNAVKISQLAKEEKDVPVYSINANGKVSIKWGRNPRLTGKNKKFVRITLDDGSFVDTTIDHKFILLNGEKKEARNLKPGDSLPRFNKNPDFLSKNNKKQYYRVLNLMDGKRSLISEHRMIAKFYEPKKWESLYNNTKNNGWVNGGIVVHHKDYNQLNNSPANLEIMTFEDHALFHGEKDNNGENNGRYSGFTNEQIQEKALEFTKELGRRFSRREWRNFAAKNGIPKAFSLWRKNGWFNSPKELSVWAAIKCGFENINADPRSVRTLQKMLNEGYKAKIQGKKVLVERTCEECGRIFEINHLNRERAFCSVSCSLNKMNNDQEMQTRRINKTILFYQKKQEEVKKQQSKIFLNLKDKLNREPSLLEWENECFNCKVSKRMGTKFGFKNFLDLKFYVENYNHKVVSVKEIDGLHDCYNITVDENHTVGIITMIRNNEMGNKIYSGIFTCNCGELPLSFGDSCRLIAINLKSFVNNKFQQPSFDFELFGKVASIAQRLSDDLIDLEIEKIEKIISTLSDDSELVLWNKILKTCRSGRRTGLGTYAVADMIACMNLRYDSDDAISLIDKVYETLRNSSYAESVELAAERGAFPVWSWEKEKDNQFIQRLPENLINKMSKVGRRNISLLTNAPTGSVSILSQTSSGIEPVFRNSYTRRKKLNQNDTHITPDFIDNVGDKFIEFEVFHHNIKNWMDLNNKNINEIPDFFVTSDSIDWEKRIDIQSAAQKYIDHSISNTINLPKGTKPELVNHIYIEAWKRGLKGCTIYVDGSRSGVLVEKKEDKKQKKHDAEKRPNELQCNIHHVSVKGQKWLILVGMMNGSPYEIFGGVEENIEIPKKFSNGKIVKVKEKNVANRYELHFGEDGVVKDIAKMFDNTNYQVHTRLISLGLRHGAGVNFVVEQLQKDPDCDMSSFSRAISRVLKKYIEDGTKATSDKKCQNCGQEEIVFKEGCLQCQACGWSKCG